MQIPLINSREISIRFLRIYNLLKETSTAFGGQRFNLSAWR